MSKRTRPRTTAEAKRRRSHVRARLATAPARLAEKDRKSEAETGVRRYRRASDVARDFACDSQEYRAALAYFAAKS